MIEVGFARPYSSHQIVVAVKLVEPGAVHMVEYLLVKILHKRLIIIRIFFLSGHMVKNRRSIDRLCQRPVHSVVYNRLAVPVCRITDARCAVCIPCICNCAAVKIFCCFKIRCCFFSVFFISRKCPLCDQSRPFNAMARCRAVRFERIVRFFFGCSQDLLPSLS